jgi:hypothetical protein
MNFKYNKKYDLWTSRDTTDIPKWALDTKIINPCVIYNGNDGDEIVMTNYIIQDHYFTHYRTFTSALNAKDIIQKHLIHKPINGELCSGCGSIIGYGDERRVCIGRYSNHLMINDYNNALSLYKILKLYLIKLSTPHPFKETLMKVSDIEFSFDE